MLQERKSGGNLQNGQRTRIIQARGSVGRKAPGITQAASSVLRAARIHSGRANRKVEPAPTCDSTVNSAPSSFAACDAMANPSPTPGCPWTSPLLKASKIRPICSGAIPGPSSDTHRMPRPIAVPPSEPMRTVPRLLNFAPFPTRFCKTSESSSSSDSTTVPGRTSTESITPFSFATRATCPATRVATSCKSTGKHAGPSPDLRSRSWSSIRRIPASVSLIDRCACPSESSASANPPACFNSTPKACSHRVTFPRLLFR